MTYQMIDKKLIVEEGVIETGSEIKKSPDKSGLIIISNSIQGTKGRLDEEVIIPDGITHIGAEAFKGHKEIKKVILPDSLIHIGEDAFDGCENLREINLPESIEIIQSGAFSNCGLLSIVWPKSVCRISDYMFANCSFLSYVDLPDTLTYIGDNAFQACNVHHWVIPSSIVSLENTSIVSSDFSKDLSANTITILKDDFREFEEKWKSYECNVWSWCRQTVLWDGNIEKIKKATIFHKLVNDFCRGCEIGYAYKESTMIRNQNLIKRLIKGIPLIEKIPLYLYNYFLSLINFIGKIVFFPVILVLVLTNYYSFHKEQYLFDQYLDKLTNKMDIYDKFRENACESAVRDMLKEKLLSKKDIAYFQMKFKNDEALRKELDNYKG